MPKAKYENFSRGDGVNDLSLKLNEMMEVVKNTNQWSTPEIRKFETIAKEKLLKGIKAGCAGDLS